MIFKNKKDGVFQYDLETNTKKPVPADFEHAAYCGKAREAAYSLAFGDSFLFLYCMKSAGFIGFMENLGFGDIAGIKALLTFVVVSRSVNFHPQDWLKDNFARLLYPEAALTSKWIGDLLAAIGGEPCLRRFSCEYLSFLRASGRSLVSFVLQSNEGGKKYKTKPCSNSEGERAVFMKAADRSDELWFPPSGDAEGSVRKEDDARLMCVVQRKTGIPLYMEYVSGGKIDAASLVARMAELKGMGVNTKFAFLDAGYVSEERLKSFSQAKISFLARLPEDSALFGSVAGEYGPELQVEENLVRYKQRNIYLKRIRMRIAGGEEEYVFLGLDPSEQPFRKRVSPVGTMRTEQAAQYPGKTPDTGECSARFPPGRFPRRICSPSTLPGKTRNNSSTRGNIF